MRKGVFFIGLQSLIMITFLGLLSCGSSDKPGSDESSLPPKKDSIAIEPKLPELLVIKGTNVNVRVSPDLKALKIKQLKTNDTCKILEKGKQETINEDTDYWYKISFKNKEGWIFGAFTSLKMPEKPLVPEKKIWYKK